MAVWKQIVIALVVLLLGAAAWLRFVPGAADQLARWGIDNAVVAAIAPERVAEARPQAQNRQGGGGGGERRGGGQPSPVIAQQVAQAKINDRLQAIGTGRALASVTVKPYSAGRVTEVLVKSGQTVKAGDVLVRLDAEGEQLALDRARIATKDAQATFERTNTLVRSNTASNVQLTQAQLAVNNAQILEREAALALERRSVLSPIGGVIGIVPVEVGNTVGIDTTIASIDDRSSLLVDFWVPERFASTVRVGAALQAVAIARPNEVIDGEVNAVDSRIDEASRTLQVRARIPNPNDDLRAGQSFQITMRFPGDDYPAVNPLAVQWSTDGAFVWAVREGKAERVPVRVVQRNTEDVLVQADLSPSDRVVTEGIHTVREGAPVQIAGSEPTVPTSSPDTTISGPRASAGEP
ncbi:MAG: efflux RND transporter periplasmic adaptor subunit [Methylobacterium mesophilicum]|nr:efflux RND transporter periplasmic adaptor subunit [Methylobacterium mesophilicum]